MYYKRTLNYLLIGGAATQTKLDGFEKRGSINRGAMRPGTWVHLIREGGAMQPRARVHFVRDGQITLTGVLKIIVFDLQIFVRGGSPEKV